LAKQEHISVGKLSGVFGIKGWVKVFSFTSPRNNILSYSPWILTKGGETKILEVLDGQQQGNSVIAHLNGINDRDQAAGLMGWDIFIHRDQLPKARKDEYYWSDLVGLHVETIDGVSLGVIDSLMETGANDVVLVRGERERAIPFLQGKTVVKIDLNAGKMVVDWDVDF
jgi:16S rRNA processing protein RimM